jgi:hypothetical protein
MNAYSTEAREKIAKEILERLAKGEPLAVICRDDFLCNAETWRRWCDADEKLAIAYARAREDGFDAIAIECLDIADATGNDTKRTQDGAEICNSEWISRSKLRVETRLKLLAKWDPKRYGEKLAVGGSDEMPPIQQELTVKFID